MRDAVDRNGETQKSMFGREDKKNGSVCCGCRAGAKRTEEDPPVASLVHTHTPGHPLAVARSCAEG